jgi:hypothetical protein
MKFKSLYGKAAGLALLSTLVSCGGVTLQRVPPGQSIRKHLEESGNGGAVPVPEKLPDPTGADMPVAATPGAAPMTPGQANPNFAGPAGIIGNQATNQRVVEPLPPLPVAGLPERNDNIERASEAYNRGSMLMKNGQHREAVTAFEETTQLDPSFSDAWTRLAMLYDKVGQPEKSREAFRRAKGLSPQPERLSSPTLPPIDPGVPPPAPSDTPIPPASEDVPLPKPVN